jgi:hypothetical protein
MSSETWITCKVRADGVTFGCLRCGAVLTVPPFPDRASAVFGLAHQTFAWEHAPCRERQSMLRAEGT